MKSKQGRPELPDLRRNNFHDLEKANTLHIPDGFINFRMLGTSTAKNDGTEVGRYGIALYGRVLYGPAGPIGIYTYDTYGSAVYK